MDRELGPLPSVAMDTGSGCRQILEHLASLGHQEFTYCAGPPGSWMGAARWAALKAGAEEHGLRARRVGPYTPTVANGGAAADGALRSGTTALVAHNDLWQSGSCAGWPTGASECPTTSACWGSTTSSPPNWSNRR